MILPPKLEKMMDEEAFRYTMSCSHISGEVHRKEIRAFCYGTKWTCKFLLPEIEKLMEALEKIADPRKRDHREPDTYTTLGCVMHIADEALTEAQKILDGD